MFSLQAASALAQMGLLALLGIALFSVLGMLGLRVLRRGAARFHAAPGASALALLPLGFGTALCSALLRQALESTSLAGSGGIAALAAGIAEALVALLAGLFCTSGLGLLGLLAVGIGSARSDARAPEASGYDWALQAAAPAALIVSGAAVVLLVQVVGALFVSPLDPQGMLWRLQAALVGSVALVVLLPSLALLVTLRAGRSPAPLVQKLVALATLVLCCAGSAVGFWTVKRQVDCLTASAMTGRPCGATETEKPR